MDDTELSMEGRSVSQKDQLPYRMILSNIVNRCFLTMGTIEMVRHVNALRMALFFTIPGLPFKDRINGMEEQLEIDAVKKKDEFKSEMGKSYYTDYGKSKVRRELHRWYWEKKLEYLLDLLAEHDALMKAKEHVESGEN